MHSSEGTFSGTTGTYHSASDDFFAAQPFFRLVARVQNATFTHEVEVKTHVQNQGLGDRHDLYREQINAAPWEIGPDGLSNEFWFGHGGSADVKCIATSGCLRWKHAMYYLKVEASRALRDSYVGAESCVKADIKEAIARYVDILSPSIIQRREARDVQDQDMAMEESQWSDEYKLQLAKDLKESEAHTLTFASDYFDWFHEYSQRELLLSQQRSDSITVRLPDQMAKIRSGPGPGGYASRGGRSSQPGNTRQQKAYVRREVRNGILGLYPVRAAGSSQKQKPHDPEDHGLADQDCSSNSAQKPQIENICNDATRTSSGTSTLLSGNLSTSQFLYAMHQSRDPAPKNLVMGSSTASGPVSGTSLVTSQDKLRGHDRTSIQTVPTTSEVEPQQARRDNDVARCFSPTTEPKLADPCILGTNGRVATDTVGDEHGAITDGKSGRLEHWAGLLPRGGTAIRGCRGRGSYRGGFMARQPQTSENKPLLGPMQLSPASLIPAKPILAAERHASANPPLNETFLGSAMMAKRADDGTENKQTQTEPTKVASGSARSSITTGDKKSKRPYVKRKTGSQRIPYGSSPQAQRRRLARMALQASDSVSSVSTHPMMFKPPPSNLCHTNVNDDKESLGKQAENGPTPVFDPESIAALEAHSKAGVQEEDSSKKI